MRYMRWVSTVEGEDILQLVIGRPRKIKVIQLSQVDKVLVAVYNS